LGRDLSRCTEGRIVQHGQILFDCPSTGFPRQALLALDALLPVRVRLDQAGIDREAFAADQPLADAAAQDRLEHAAEKVALAEAAVPVLGEGRVVGHLAVEPEPAEPAVREVEVDSSQSRRSERMPKQ
jgi:hypothetical protein